VTNPTGAAVPASGSFKTGWWRAVETAAMSESVFTPALGRFAPTRFYDRVVALTRERVWRPLVAMHVAPRPGETIVDVGCGTGSLVSLLAEVAPGARIVGLDPDPDMLAVARHKAGPAVEWHVGMGDAVAELLGAGTADTVVSSLVLHQCPDKPALLAAMHALLRPGGKLVIADYGLQRTRPMRLAFRTVQLADGKADTQPNADGALPGLIAAVGFREVREVAVVPTVTGSISIYVAGRD
jgi:SAM-dependent methyltransferase